MSRRKKNFKNFLIGLNKSEVENYIDFIKRDNEEKVNEKLSKIKELEKNNLEIKEKIDNLKNEMISKVQSKEMMEFAIEKAEEWAKVLLENADKKVAEIEAFGKEQEVLINKKIEAYNKVLRDSKEKLNNLLNIEIQRNIQLIEEMDKFISDENVSINQVKDKKRDNIIHYDDIKGERNTKKDNDEKSSENESLLKEESKQKSNESIEEVTFATHNVVNDNSLNIISSNLTLEKDLEIDEINKFDINTSNEEISEVNEEIEEVNQEDSDLTREINEDTLDLIKENSNENIDNLINDEIYFDHLNDEEINVTFEEKNALIENQQLNDGITEKDFWGEEFNDSLLETSIVEKGYGNEVIDELNNIENLNIESDYTKDEEKTETVIKDVKTIDKKEENDDLSTEKKGQASNAIDGEIQNIRRKYIVGKIAGDDLLDRNGNLIIKKNDIITIETVQLAEREGKLANLIVDMKLPEGS